MKFITRSTVALVIGILIATAGATTAQAATGQDQVASAVNSERVAAGLSTLKRDPVLDAAAQEWAQVMSSANKMSHSTTEWRSARIPAAWTTQGENVAYGYRTAAAVMSGWMGSPGHKENILRSSYTRIGVGYVAAGNYWVQIFAGYNNDAAVAAAPITPGTVPVYRFWSPVFQGHFFTTNKAERDSLIANSRAVWTYEGEKYRAFATQVPGTVPLYRFWSEKFRGHFFTTNETEKQIVIDKYDDATWNFEGVAYYVYPESSTAANSSPVYRFWSSSYNHHFFTANSREAEATKKYPTDIWNYERVAFKVPR